MPHPDCSPSRRHAPPRPLLVLLLVVFAAVPTWAQEGDAVADGEEIPVLRPADVVAPRLLGGPQTPGSDESVTATRGRLRLLRVPNAVSVLTQEEIRLKRASRSLSDALQGLPGVLVQKTGPMQHSPFIRGFTGYHNLLLIDGIRFNNASFRGGPNQYWATIDQLAIARLELVRGPQAVLYGSDAVGGTVNVLPWRRTSFEPGRHTDSSVYLRASSGENAYFGRIQTEGNQDDLGWAVGLSRKRYGNIDSGGGTLPGTGGIEEWDADVRFDRRFARFWELTLAWQHVDQTNAPRTEKTVASVPFHGTSGGSELRRDFDQRRDLAYTRLAFDAGSRARPFSRGHLTFSYQRHGEQRTRLRTGDRLDRQGFSLRQVGVQAQLESPTRLGTFTYGASWYHDDVDSRRRNFTAGGVLGSPVIQGPLGDDATYDLFGAYIEDHLAWQQWEVLLGGRFTYAAADANRVDNPAVAGSDPATPGNVIGVSRDWTNLSGSLRVLYHWNPKWTFYGGVAQSFRTPSLHDLTSLESTSVVETPSPNLDPEKFVSFEVGVKTEQERLRYGVAGWYTILNDTIIRSPTGVLIGGVPEVRKDNIGDGWVWGVDLDASWRASRAWALFGTLSYMDGEVDQFDSVGALRRRPLSRMKPFSFWTGVRYTPECSSFWAQLDVAYSAREDRLSFRDETDKRRIPPGGTPSWTRLNLRAGGELTPKVHVSIALENLTDANYRIHGSGQNEPGRSVVLALGLDL